MHPNTKDNLRVGSFVGTSNNQARKERLGDWRPATDQGSGLEDLRSGAKNLIVATSVLEEGIDITACNLVVCFDPPVNLRSFVQRRGRARHEQSRYIIMYPEQAVNSLLACQELEKIMDKMYVDDKRKIEELEALEASEQGHKELYIPKTG